MVHDYIIELIQRSIWSETFDNTDNTTMRKLGYKINESATLKHKPIITINANSLANLTAFSPGAIRYVVTCYFSILPSPVVGQ